MSLAFAAALWALQGPVPPPAEPAPQAPAEASAPAEEAPAARSLRWQTLNKVDMIVNGDCITSTDVVRLAVAQRKPVNTPRERAQLFQEMAVEQLRLLLAVQGGKDLGFDQQMVDRMVRDELDRRLEEVGSISRLANLLARDELDSSTYKGDVESYIYSQLWTLSVTGKFPGPQGRPYVDRYVRPGELAFEFVRQGSNLDLPTRLVLRELVVLPRGGRTIEEALLEARELRRRIVEEGEDFLEAGERYDAVDPRTRGLMPAFTLETLRPLGPEYAAFVEQAQVGEVSEVLPAHADGALRGFRILKVEERHEGKAARFEDREFQRSMVEQLQRQRDERRREKALGSLLDAAYVWPPEVFGRARGQDAAPKDAAP